MNDKRLKHIANQNGNWVYNYLVTVCQLPPDEAKQTAINAADKAAQSLAQDLNVNA